MTQMMQLEQPQLVGAFSSCFCFCSVHSEAPNRCMVIKQNASSHHLCRWRAAVLPRGETHTEHCIFFSSSFFFHVSPIFERQILCLESLC